ncbi:hypothetical protein DB35_13170 [Streptomyces abyssalis]|uniref:Uncharacterized protein n=1 Tax=Streptomyces abyssalis TaxID=933944 RepID=A0A1E7JGS2_9ACTN|nr:hypothetical protein [Streptomyces abyssalis]OEU85675.1 hypothetical protein AN215_24810 [Streptomyces abyssalis]OEU92860.1 hypothetical protein DB35_13170 [Streptomyces abyssalis]OEV30488.1 hypothetical protein AN219_10245 [Streptomyces nanshensis]
MSRGRTLPEPLQEPGGGDRPDEQGRAVGILSITATTGEPVRAISSAISTMVQFGVTENGLGRPSRRQSDTNWSGTTLSRSAYLSSMIRASSGSCLK